MDQSTNVLVELGFEGFKFVEFEKIRTNNSILIKHNFLQIFLIFNTEFIFMDFKRISNKVSF